MCTWLDEPLTILNVHGGTTEREILDTFHTAEQATNEGKFTRHHVFLDEMNTCAHMGLIKEAICNRSLNGVPIHPCIQILAALNPYRRRREQQVSTGLVYQKGERQQAQNIMESLVYRVHPISRTLHEFVFDFGSLDPETETQYIHAMVRARIPSHHRSCASAITSMIASAHKYVREVELDASSVSLRDVKRTIDLLRFFDRDGFGSGSSNQDVKTCTPIILAICHVYYFRLPQQREFFLTQIRVALKHETQVGACHVLIQAGLIEKILFNAQKRVVSKLIVEEGIAMNAALQENLYVVILCILHRIPVFVVGKPGSSKTLTMQVISHNLQGDQSPSQYWRKFPRVYVFSYQCSPLSTADRIEHQYHMACNYQQSAHNTVTVLLLDEVGLAEHSPDMPLKVMHAMLVDPQVSIVGLSNWVLDPAKMNRAVCLQRTTPQENEIQQTGWVISESGNTASDDQPQMVRTPSGLSRLRPWLAPVSKAYHAVYTTQQGREFIGMRDYYQLVKQLLRCSNLNDVELVFALCRNFGGLPDVLEHVITTFATSCQDDVKCTGALLSGDFETAQAEAEEEQPVQVRRFNLQLPSVHTLIRANLQDDTGRHLMLLTKAGVALRLLVGSGLLDPANSSVLIGSHFEHDLTDLQLVQQINKVKLAMASGSTVVLLNHDNIYEALYDVLNQRYVTKTTVSGTRRMLRLAIGHQSQLCPVEPGFKIIAIVEESHARTNLDLPLLNRFEKQLLLPTALLQPNHQTLLTSISTWIDCVMSEVGIGSHSSVLLPGVHENTLPMLVLTLSDYKEPNEEDLEALLLEAQTRLLHMSTPVAVHHSIALRTLDQHQTVPYFEAHRDIASSIRWHFESASGAPLLVLTHSPVPHLAGDKLTSLFPGADFMRLSDLTSESQLHFMATTLYHHQDPAHTTMIVQCDPSLTHQPLIDHARYVFAQQWATSQYTDERHLVFIIHLPPSHSKDSLRAYSLDVQAPWSHMFVDDVRISLEEAPIEQLMQVSISDLIASGAVDIHRVILSNLTSAVGLCADSFFDIETSGLLRLRLVHDMFNSDQLFVELMRDMCVALLQTAIDNSSCLMEQHVQLACTDCASGSLRQSLGFAIETMVTT